MTRRDYYQVLGIARSSAPAEVRAAYARLVRRHHPDRDGELTIRLADVQEAYRCLSDPIARAAHDRDMAMADRIHAERQDRVRQRLRRYDRRHPSFLPMPHRRWGRFAAMTGGMALLTGLLALTFL